MLVSLALSGCITTVHPGLTNVPTVNTSPVADANVRDAVANGRDSCERGLGPGALRYQIPACPGVERPPGLPAIITAAPTANGSVTPWVERCYARWAFYFSGTEASRMTLANPASPFAASGHGPTLTCAGPL
jgi:hypothetical protein